MTGKWRVERNPWEGTGEGARWGFGDDRPWAASITRDDGSGTTIAVPERWMAVAIRDAGNSKPSRQKRRKVTNGK